MGVAGGDGMGWGPCYQMSCKGVINDTGDIRSVLNLTTSNAPWHIPQS